MAKLQHKYVKLHRISSKLLKPRRLCQFGGPNIFAFLPPSILRNWLDNADAVIEVS